MPLKYVNRCGDSYAIMQGETKTGKPRFWCTKRASSDRAGVGVAVERLPDGYEIYERPQDGLVSVRKTRVSRIQPSEHAFLTQRATQLEDVATIVDIEEGALVVFATEISASDRVGLLETLMGEMSPAMRQDNLHWIARHARYSPMLRFSLANESKRLYRVERWCFRGRIDDWVRVAAPMPLESAAKAYLPHLGKESFYELM